MIFENEEIIAAEADIWMPDATIVETIHSSATVLVRIAYSHIATLLLFVLASLFIQVPKVSHHHPTQWVTFWTRPIDGNGLA